MTSVRRPATQQSSGSMTHSRNRGLGGGWLGRDEILSIGGTRPSTRDGSRPGVGERSWPSAGVFRGGKRTAGCVGAPGGFEAHHVVGSLPPAEDTSSALVAPAEGHGEFVPYGAGDRLATRVSSRDAAVLVERDRHRQELDAAWKRVHKAQLAAAEEQRQHTETKRRLQRAVTYLCDLDEQRARFAVVAEEADARHRDVLLPLASAAWTHVCPPSRVEAPIIRDSDVMRALRSTERMVSLLKEELRCRDSSWDAALFQKAHSQELVQASSEINTTPDSLTSLVLRHAASFTGASVPQRAGPARPMTQPGRKRRGMSALT